MNLLRSILSAATAGALLLPVMATAAAAAPAPNDTGLAGDLVDASGSPDALGCSR
jgi:hypothetical protein